jgi:hypothetical protein
LNLDIVKQELESWICDFLSKAHPSFNLLPPCPYAKTAWEEDKVLVVIDDPLIHFDPDLLYNKDVVVYVFDTATITVDKLYDIATEINQQYPTIVALDDHPNHKETVDDVVLNQSRYALLLIQRRDKLEHARSILESKGYYKNWDRDYLAEVWGM